jgi:ubiquinone/menaquinone biosynthesis C-methylase UbiE
MQPVMESVALIRNLTNTRVRGHLHQRLGARRLHELGGPLPGPRVLEIGCGQGLGIEQIREVFGPAKIDAFDLDEEMVKLARARLARFDGVRLWRGDATRIDAPDNSYDAAFEFIVLHHVPEWRRALGEAFRVLRPGGVFYIEEILPGSLLPAAITRRASYLASAFSDGNLRAALLEAGFEVLAAKTTLGLFGWYVARKPGGTDAEAGRS